MGSSSTKEIVQYSQLVERPPSKEAYVMIGRHTPLRNFKGTFRVKKSDSELVPRCSRCKKLYDSESLWFLLAHETSVCFVCYSKRRVHFLLRHHFLCKQALIVGSLPREIQEVIFPSSFLDTILYSFYVTFEPFRLPPLCHMYPYLQYNVIKHIDDEFFHFSWVNYVFSRSDRICIRVEQRNNRFSIYLKNNQTEETLYARMENYLSMMESLNSLIEVCLMSGEYNYYYQK